MVAPREGAEQKFKRQAASLIAEFFASADVDAATADLAELNPPQLRHLFVKRLLSLALDRNNKHKELAVELISAAFPSILTSENIEQGFLDLLASVQDLELDCPNAGDAIAAFLARAVVDDVLPPAFLTKAAAKGEAASLRGGEEGSGAMNGGGAGGSSGRGLGASASGSSEDGSGAWQRAVEVVRAAEAKLKDPLHALALEQAWGGPPGTMSYEAAKEKIQMVLEELAAGGEQSEAMRRIRELELPFFHHEVRHLLCLCSSESELARPQSWSCPSPSSIHRWSSRRRLPCWWHKEKRVLVLILCLFIPCLSSHQLRSPQVVKAAVTKAMENPSKEPLLLGLLKEASDEGVIAGSQVGGRAGPRLDMMWDPRRVGGAHMPPMRYNTPMSRLACVSHGGNKATKLHKSPL